jgi:hypothetical protein
MPMFVSVFVSPVSSAASGSNWCLAEGRDDYEGAEIPESGALQRLEREAEPPDKSNLPRALPASHVLPHNRDLPLVASGRTRIRGLVVTGAPTQVSAPDAAVSVKRKR